MSLHVSRACFRCLAAQVQTIAQPVHRTMQMVSVLLVMSYILRALWLFLKESELLDNDDTGCVNSWHCPKIFVTTLNRAGSYCFFVAFSLLGEATDWLLVQLV